MNFIGTVGIIKEIIFIVCGCYLLYWAFSTGYGVHTMQKTFKYKETSYDRFIKCYWKSLLDHKHLLRF